MSRNHGIILGSGRGRRRLDGSKSLPMPLIPWQEEKPVLDWVLAAFRSAGIEDPVFVGGYHLEKVVDHYPGLRFVYHRRWSEEGEAAALRHAAPECGDADTILIVRADTVIMPAAVSRLTSSLSGVAAGYHGTARKFSGAIAVSGRAARALWTLARDSARQAPGASLSDLLAVAPDVAWVDLTGLATPVDDPETVMETIFAGKGRTLEQLASVARSAVVLDQLRFTTALWKASPDELIAQIKSKFSPGKIIIRSCTRAEDRHWNTGAGAYRSELDVSAQDGTAIARGMNQVIQSYARDGREVDPQDEVLVQPQQEVKAAGVLFTRDPNSGAPYYVLNVESLSGKPDVVTSGREGVIETSYVSWLAPSEGLAQREAHALALARELVSLTRVDALDIEFSFGPDERCYLFQVRPLLIARQSRIDLDEDLHLLLQEAQRFVRARLKPTPTLLGKRTVFGNMPDWNPAEMLGVTPRPLALSLYQALIGERAWSAGRAALGYRDAGPHPLILSIAGRAYVDVRASLNSFLPAGVPDDAGSLWIDHCTELLLTRPELHDKLEFEVTITCASPDPARDRLRLLRGGLQADQAERFLSTLQQLTSSVVADHARMRADILGRIEVFRATLQRVVASALAEPTDAGYRVALLVDLCRANGIVPFVIAARKAFIAMQMLRSLAESGALSEGDVGAIQKAIPTVATRLLGDLSRLAAGSLKPEAFLREYGHVRPSSYDITSPNYAACWSDVISARSSAPPDGDPADGARVIQARWQAIDKATKAAGFAFSGPEHFFAFVSECIADRELVKFEFMKAVDAILHAIAEFGRFYALEPADLSFLQLAEISRYAHDSASGATGERLSRAIAYRRKRHELSEALHLPDLIGSPQDLVVIRPRAGLPNFVTRKRVQAPIVFLDDGQVREAIQGKIVAARAADPGYDWIFGHGIAGLVTEYGGVASHMAIRAAEFGIPAAIGCGNVIYDQLKNAKMVELDAANRKLRRIS